MRRLAFAAAALLAAAPARAGTAVAPIIPEVDQLLFVGDCHYVPVQTVDSTDNPTPPANAMSLPVSITSGQGLGLYSDSSCSTPTSTVSFSSASANSHFYVRGSTPGHGSYQVQWGQNGGSGGAAFIPVGTKLAFLGSPGDVQPGTSFAVQVGVEDPSGTVESYAFHQVALSLQPAGGANLTQPSLVFANNGVAGFGSISIDKPGSYQLVANAVANGSTPNPNLAQAVSTSFRVTWGAVRLDAFSAAQTLPAGACSGRVDILPFTASNGGTSVDGPTTVALAASGVGATFYSDAQCAQAISSVQLTTAASEGSFYFKAAAPGGLVITFTAAGLAQGSQVETVVAPGGDAGPSDAGTTPATDGGATASATADGGADDDRTLNGFGCASGGGGGWLLVGVALAALLWRRRSSRSGAALFALALCAAGAASAASAPAHPRLLAVLKLRNKLQGQDRAALDDDYLADAVRSAALRLSPAVRVMTRENMLALLQQSGRTLGDCEGECEVETGRRLSADLVVSGDLLRVGSELRLLLRLHDTHDGQLLAATEAAGRDTDELDKSAKASMRELLSKLEAQADAAERAPLVAEQAPSAADRAPPVAVPAPGAPPSAQAAPALVQPAAPVAQVAQPVAQSAQAAGEVAAAREPAGAVASSLSLYLGAAFDPRASTVGPEAAVRAGLTPWLQASAGVVVGPHPGGRLGLALRLFEAGPLQIWAGPQGLVEPVSAGVAVGGGLGARLELSLASWLALSAGGAGELYKTPTATTWAPLATAGFVARL